MSLSSFAFSVLEYTGIKILEIYDLITRTPSDLLFRQNKRKRESIKSASTTGGRKSFFRRIRQKLIGDNKYRGCSDTRNRKSDDNKKSKSISSKGLRIKVESIQDVSLSSKSAKQQSPIRNSNEARNEMDSIFPKNNSTIDQVMADHHQIDNPMNSDENISFKEIETVPRASKEVSSVTPSMASEKIQKLESELGRLREEIAKIMLNPGLHSQDRLPSSQDPKHESDVNHLMNAACREEASCQPLLIDCLPLPPPVFFPESSFVSSGPSLPIPPPPDFSKFTPFPEDIADKSDSSLMPPPPPPPFNNTGGTIHSYALRKRKEALNVNANFVVAKRAVQRSTSISLADIINRSSSLRKVEIQRSPGGTPMRLPSVSNYPLNSQELITQALKKKFQQVQHAAMSPEVSPASKLNSSCDDSFWNDESDKENLISSNMTNSSVESKPRKSLKKAVSTGFPLPPPESKLLSQSTPIKQSSLPVLSSSPHQSIINIDSSLKTESIASNGHEQDSSYLKEDYLLKVSPEIPFCQDDSLKNFLPISSLEDSLHQFSNNCLIETNDVGPYII